MQSRRSLKDEITSLKAENEEQRSLKVKFNREIQSKQWRIDELKALLNHKTIQNSNNYYNSEKLKKENDELRAKITELTELKDDVKYMTRIMVAHEIGSKVMELEKENRKLKNTKWHKEYQKVVAKLEKIVNKNKEVF